MRKEFFLGRLPSLFVMSSHRGLWGRTCMFVQIPLVCVSSGTSILPHVLILNTKQLIKNLSWVLFGLQSILCLL